MLWVGDEDPRLLEIIPALVRLVNVMDLMPELLVRRDVDEIEGVLVLSKVEKEGKPVEVGETTGKLRLVDSEATLLTLVI